MKKIWDKGRCLWGILFYLGYVIFASANWIVRQFGEVSYEQVIFHLNMPFTSESTLIINYCKYVLLIPLLIFGVLYFVLHHSFKNKIILLIQKILVQYRLILGILWLVFACVWFFFKLNVRAMLNYHQYKFEPSTFYEENYVKPEEVKITFPKKKKNLILIFAESMESSYAKTKAYNYFGDEIIPELHDLMNKHTHFSDNDEIGGAFPIDGTQWTQAGLFSQTCGIPIQLPINSNNFHPQNGFFPGAFCLYDLLKLDNYEESFLIGSNREFAGMNKFVETHADQKLLDTLYYGKRDNLFLGVERRKKFPDKQVFEYAKEELNNLAKSKKPFALTMMTLDTHFGKRLFEESVCQQKYPKEKRIENVVSCASYQLGSFVNWIQQQPFYKDTVIVIVGDHLTMNPRFTKEMQRKPINIFINSDLTAQKSKNRTFTPFDIYPTIVESMGIQISGHKLALGTSLYANVPTLTEGKMSLDDLDINVRKKSKLYDYLLFGKDIH